MLLAHDRADGAPDSVIVMHLSDSAVALSSEELGVFGKTGPAELPFVNVQRYLARLSDAVPAVYARSADATMLALEDVGDVTLWEAVSAANDGGRALFSQRARMDRRSAGAGAR